MGVLPRLLLPAILGASVFVISSVSPAMQSGAGVIDEKLLGTWRLDVTRSRYSPGPPPKAEVRSFMRDESGLKGRIERHHADGRVEIIDYRADADRDAPVAGTQAYDTARFKRVDAYTTEAVLSHAGRVYGIARRIISPDGETLTITFRREEPGDMVDNFAVYSKERK